MDPSEFKSLERWTCRSCQTINTAFDLYCVACHTPGDAPYVHIRNPTPQETELPFQNNVELPPFSSSHTIAPYTGYTGQDQETHFARENSSGYRPQPYNPAIPDKVTFGGPSCFIPLQNDLYLDEKHLIENSGGDQEWINDPVLRPHAPIPYDHEDTVLVPEYDYSFMQPQEIEQMYSIQSFFNNSLGAVPNVPINPPPPSPMQREDNGEEMRFSLTESAKYEFFHKHHSSKPQIYPRLTSITERENNWVMLEKSLPDSVVPASALHSSTDPAIIVIRDDPPVPSPRKHAPDTSSIPPVPTPRRTPTSSLVIDPTDPPVPTVPLGDLPKPTDASAHLKKKASFLQAAKLDAVNTEGKTQIDEIMAFLKEQKFNFIDPSFHPSPKSLFINPHTPARTITQKVVWLRPGEIRTRAGRMKWSIFNHPNPADVCQGTLGNCWFLSALSVVAEKEQLIHNLVLTKEINKQGIYQVRLCMCGEWQVVTIDDYFPCRSGANHQMYSEAVRNQLWMCLIEKAAAKLYGCYEALNKGTLIEGLSTLTGAPCETIGLLGMIQESGSYQNEVKNVIWSQITHFKSSNYLLGASTGNPDISEEVYKSVGLSAHHAYAVLDVSEMEGNRLVCLRDPNGVSRWKGDWSDKSEKWTRAMRQQLIPGGEEGIFWISIDDICNYFTTVDVCKVRLDYNEARESAIFPPFLECHSPVYLVEVFDKTEFDISLYQPNRRFRENEKKEQVMNYATDPTDLSVIIFRTFDPTEEGRSAPSPTKFVGFIDRKRQACVSRSFLLGKGHYLIVPQAFCHWDSDYIVPYTIATFSSKAHILESRSTRPGFFAECLIMLGKAKGTSIASGSSSIHLYKMEKHFNGALFVVENKSDYHFNIRIEDVQCINLTSTRGSITTQDCVPPHHKQVLNIVSISDPSRSYLTAFGFTKSYSQQNTQGDYGSVSFPELTHKNREIHNPIFI